MTTAFQDFLKDSFPIINSCTYLNTASSGLISKKLLEFRNQYNQGIYHDHTKIDYLEDEKIDTLRKKIQTYFHAEKAEIALLGNFSIGLNFIAEAIPEKSKVLLLNGDYPSVNFPFEQRNFELCYAEIDEQLEQNMVKKIEENKPDYLAFSLVQFISGIAIDFDFFKELKSNYPNLQIIGDATQYLGSEAFHFDTSPFSVIGSSGYKWFNAGTGNAFFMLKNEFVERLKPKSYGSNSLLVKPNGPLRKVGFLEPGHFDMHSLKSLEVALDFHYNEVGIYKIEEQIKRISELAKEAFIHRNLLSKIVVNRKKHAHLFNLKGDEKMFAELQKQKIVCAMRGGGIRIGFQYFNNQADLEKLLQVLDENQRNK